MNHVTLTVLWESSSEASEEYSSPPSRLDADILGCLRDPSNLSQLKRLLQTNRTRDIANSLTDIDIRGNQVTRTAVGVSALPEKKRYKGVRFNVISATRGWVGVICPVKKRHVTLQ